MREAMLYEKLPDNRVRCGVCQWRCTIPPDKYGQCRMRQNINGTLRFLNYGEISSAGADPIEKKPLFHFYPGSQVFSLGGWGCNFKCNHCQNWQISHEFEQRRDVSSQNISPETAIELTKKCHCQGIAWTYNEPCIWLEYTLDSAKLAKQENLYTVYVTNGYFTKEALDLMGPYLDAWRVDLKGFSDQLYKDLAGISKWRKILEIAKRAQNKWDMHVEVVTNIIPTLNDDEPQLKAMARWIYSELGELTPWHVTRFHPQHNMQHLPATPLSTIEKAMQIGKSEGLRFTYPGNTPGHPAENTSCYSCGKLVVERSGYQARIIGLEGSKCAFCGAELNFRR